MTPEEKEVEAFIRDLKRHSLIHAVIAALAPIEARRARAHLDILISKLDSESAQAIAEDAQAVAVALGAIGCAACMAAEKGLAASFADLEAMSPSRSVDWQRRLREVAPIFDRSSNGDEPPSPAHLYAVLEALKNGASAESAIKAGLADGAES